jgi:hypothetical protein
MTEKEFLDHIDCKFPYHDRDNWKRVVDTGKSISSNAAFAVLDEISRPPRSADTSSSDRMEMVAYWRSGFEHPLADEVSKVALARVEGRGLSIEHCLELMDTISHHLGQYAALSIVYFACESDEAEETDRKWDGISDQWQSQLAA